MSDISYKAMVKAVKCPALIIPAGVDENCTKDFEGVSISRHRDADSRQANFILTILTPDGGLASASLCYGALSALTHAIASEVEAENVWQHTPYVSGSRS